MAGRIEGEYWLRFREGGGAKRVVIIVVTDEGGGCGCGGGWSESAEEMGGYSRVHLETIYGFTCPNNLLDIFAHIKIFVQLKSPRNRMIHC